VHTIDLPDMPEPGGAPPEKSVHPPQDQANLLGIITDVGATDNGGARALRHSAACRRDEGDRICR
jgi:hypothetical protein